MFYSASDTVGQIVLTASGVVGDSGKAQCLYGYAFKSGATAGTLTLFNGTSSVAPATVAFDQTGVISSTVFNPIGFGVMFTSGIYASMDGNITRATFWVRQFLS